MRMFYYMNSPYGYHGSYGSYARQRCGHYGTSTRTACENHYGSCTVRAMAAAAAALTRIRSPQ